MNLCATLAAALILFLVALNGPSKDVVCQVSPGSAHHSCGFEAEVATTLMPSDLLTVSGSEMRLTACYEGELKMFLFCGTLSILC